MNSIQAQKIRKLVDLTSVISKSEKISPNEALIRLREKASETCEMINENSDILNLYMSYQRELQNNYSRDEIVKTIISKSETLISKIAKFYNVKEVEAYHMFRTSPMFIKLCSLGTKYWKESESVLFLDYLKMEGSTDLIDYTKQVIISEEDYVEEVKVK